MALLCIQESLDRIACGKDRPDSVMVWPPDSPAGWLLKQVEKFGAAWRAAPRDKQKFCPHARTYFRQARYIDPPDTKDDHAI